MRKAALAVLILALFTTLALAAARGTPDEAKAMMAKAAEFYKEKGQEAAFAEYNKADGKFVKGDIYVFAFDSKGVVLAHGVNPKLIGKSLMEIKDADGKTFMKDFVAVMEGKGEGSVGYKWNNPETKKIEPKISFIKKVGKDVALGCGSYAN